MPLDEATRRFSFLLQRDLRRMAERHEEHVARGDEIKFDSGTHIAIVHARRGEAVSRLHGEALASYAPRDRILRWAWAGRSPNTSTTHGDVLFREGQARGVAQLTMSVVGDLDEEEARTLVKLGALVARAEGVHERRVGADIEFVGLFERSRPPASDPPASRFSVPPPPATERSQPTGPPPRAYRSIPPIREVFEPRTQGSRPPPSPVAGAPGAATGTSWSNLGAAGTSSSASPPAVTRTPSSRPPPATPPATSPAAPAKKLREPSRALFLPVANAALAALTRGSKGYVQGLFVLTLDNENRDGEPRRFMVQLVVVDVAGILRALDPPIEVVEAATSMVEADRREGNGTWRKLSARISPKPDGGATLHVDVL